MIDEKVYQHYLDSLLAGNHSECQKVVQQYLDAKIELKELYAHLFQRSMYQVGELWESNRITVAREHLATSITEGLLNIVYPSIFATERSGKKAIVSCCANEFHQIGGKMVADIFELNGWDGHFLGSNSPVEVLLEKTQKLRPDIVGLSLSLLSNIDFLKRTIEVVQVNFPKVHIIAGGQAFRWGGIDILKHYSGLEYIASLDVLEKMILEY